MNSDSSGLDDSSQRIGDQVDIVCDQFESELRKGRIPQIEDYLESISKAGRAQLLRELIGLEIDYMRQRGHAVDFEGYFARFPGDTTMLAGLRDELKLDRIESAITPPAIGDTDDTISVEHAHPQRVNRFELRSIAGEGGFGRVWRAFDTRLEREVAIKLPHKDRFARGDISAVLQEAQAAANLKHPNIVPVHEIGEGDDNHPPFIVTAFVDGPNLKTLLETRQLTSLQVTEILGKVARALDHAHCCGIIHCDLKPSNVLLDKSGEPHLVDFGLAKRMNSLELVGHRGGTLPYMPPEQVRGAAVIDCRADIYSLGVMLYELLTSQRPFCGTSDSVIDQITHADPKPPSEIKPTVSVELERVCLKCLTKDPSLRYQTASALAEDLELLSAGDLPKGVPVSQLRRIASRATQNRRSMLTLGLTASACLAVPGGLWWWNRPADARRLVEITTDPPGCEITVVTVDRVTGEPDPTQIRKASGRTPLTLKLAPGDYMIVVVAADGRFHEVPRHVPDFNESGLLIYKSRYAKIHDDGCIRFLGDIILPTAITDTVSVVNGAGEWHPPESPATPLIIPSFLVEQTAHAASPDLTVGPQLSHFYAAQSYAELMGMRLPSDLEFQYLAHLNRQGLIHPPVEGLSTDPWEWTTTKFGPTTFLGAMRILRGGTLTAKDGSSIVDPKRLASEADGDPNFAVRCVRSLRPRIRVADYPRSTSD